MLAAQSGEKVGRGEKMGKGVRGDQVLDWDIEGKIRSSYPENKMV
jgi:hypothetical protein